MTVVSDESLRNSLRMIGWLMDQIDKLKRVDEELKKDLHVEGSDEPPTEGIKRNPYRELGIDDLKSVTDIEAVLKQVTFEATLCLAALKLLKLDKSVVHTHLGEACAHLNHVLRAIEHKVY